MNLTVVILSYNVEKLLKKAIQAVYDTYKEKDLQIIVVDNASTDQSALMVKKNFPKVELIVSKVNTGYAKGNNLARKITNGEVVLFLNPDTELHYQAIEKCLEILESRKEIGAVTCKVMLSNGKIDYSCHRGLPTVWNTFCFFFGLSKMFPKSSFFTGYNASHLDINESHYIDCISGTFLMVKRNALEKIDWWDEDYFWNGDDIEFCYKLKQAEFKIWYEPTVTMMHYKGSSSGLQTTSRGDASKETKIRSAKSAARAMRIFTDKHWRELGPWPVMAIVRCGIFVLEKFRLWKIESGLRYG